MHHMVVRPYLQHLHTIGLDQGTVTLATAFYSRRPLMSLPIQAESVTVLCRLDINSTEEWKRGLVAPDALLSFLQAQQQRGASTLLYAAPTAHAKVYLGNRAVLIGSANLTMRGFGGGDEIVSRLHGRRALQKARHTLNEYQSSLKKIEIDALQEYVEKNEHCVQQSEIKKENLDQLPIANWNARLHLCNYDDFLHWLQDVPEKSASKIFRRAKGASQLGGHINYNFHGLRQFFFVFPKAFDEMRHADSDTYKLYQDKAMEKNIHDFINQFALNEKLFEVVGWKTYLPKKLGGVQTTGGGTVGNLNHMLPLVATYLAEKLALDSLDRTHK